MTSFIITASIIFGLLGLIWSRKDLFNLLIKAAFFGIMIWGILLSLQGLGYLIKA